MPPCAIPQSLRVSAALHGLAGNEHEERIKDGRHVGLDFYDLLIEAILALNAHVKDIFPNGAYPRVIFNSESNLQFRE